MAPSADDPRPWERDDRPLHAALRAAGAQVETPAWDDPSVDWTGFDRVVPRATWDYHHHRDAFLRWIDRVGPRLSNPAATLAWNTDKIYLRDLPVPQPETAWVGPGDDLAEILAARGWDRALLKPRVGATAEGTLRFDRAQVAAAQAHVAAAGRGFLLQPYVAGVETMGERSAIVIGGEVTHAVRKDPLPGDYRVQDDYGATDGPHSLEPAERSLVEAAVAALPPETAYARIDWLITDRGPALIELELVEPCLFFRHGPHAAAALARVWAG